MQPAEDQLQPADVELVGERRALKRSTKRRIAEIFAGAADTETRLR